MSRDPQTVQREIEQAREALARSLDQLAERTSPKRAAQRGRAGLVARVKSPAGVAVLGTAAALTAFLIIRRVRR